MKNIKYFIFEKLALHQNKNRENHKLKKEEVKSVLLIRQDNRIGNIIVLSMILTNFFGKKE